MADPDWGQTHVGRQWPQKAVSNAVAARTKADAAKAETKGKTVRRRKIRRAQPVRQDVIAALSTATREIEVSVLRGEVVTLRRLEGEVTELRQRLEQLEAKLLEVTQGSPNKFGWLSEVYKLTAEGRVNAAIDVLFENVDELNSDDCDQLLHAVDLNRLDTHLLVGLLSITLSRAADLTHRSKVVEMVERRLEEIAPDRVARLMVGLR